jgi:class 3 adenylate cyclase
MPASSSDIRELLLAILRLLEQGPMPARELVRASDRLVGHGHGRRGTPGRVLVALEALEAEGLVEPAALRGSAVHRITREGSDAVRRHADGGAGSAHEQVTILFTDMVGSTAMLDRLGDAAAHELRRRHFALLRGAARDHGGREVKSLGDGLMLAFADARAALECALAMQRAVTDDEDPLQVRIGIASGATVCEDGDHFGRPVIVARRLCDAARGGDVLVSEPMRDLVAAGGAAHGFESLGPLALKGLREPVVASAVRAPSLALSA